MSDVTQCPQCGGGQTGDAPMCQWCGRVDPESAMGKAQARRRFWIATAIWTSVGAAVIVAVVVFLTVQLDNSRDNSRDDLCDRGIASQCD
jgi:uncharacterized membrane protein YvbJ